MYIVQYIIDRKVVKVETFWLYVQITLLLILVYISPKVCVHIKNILALAHYEECMTK
jgi:hypothetical protein